MKMFIINQNISLFMKIYKQMKAFTVKKVYLNGFLCVNNEGQFTKMPWKSKT